MSAICLVAVACSSVGDNDTALAPTSATAPTTSSTAVPATGDPDTNDTGTNDTDANDADGAVGVAGDDTAAERSSDGAIGNVGIGDPLFPQMGNGGYEVIHYDLDITVDNPAIDATATIVLNADEPLDTFNLDLIGLTVRDVTLDGTPADFDQVDNELIIDPDTVVAQGQPIELVIDYDGSPTPIDDPAGPAPLGWYSEPWGTFVLSEPSGAPTWFPANDHPRDKATFTFTVTVPSDEVAIAAGLNTSTIDNGDGTTTWTYEMDDPMATYLASVVTGDLVIVEEPPIDREQGDDIVIRHVFPTADAERLADVAERHRPMFDFFAERFGPYPFDSYGMAVVEADLGFAALENQTLSVFGSDIVGPFVPDSLVDQVMAHELVHQWFGNSVSPEQWGDIWLNEGFATWGEFAWVEETTGDDPWVGVPDLDRLVDLEAPALFDSNVYFRGGQTLEALRRTVGDDTFFTILRTWAERYEGTVASTEDFLALVEELADATARDVVLEWVTAPDPPEMPPR